MRYFHILLIDENGEYDPFFNLVNDLNDPDQWETDFSPDVLSAPEVTFESGRHVLFVDALDTWGNSTPIAIEITVAPRLNK